VYSDDDNITDLALSTDPTLVKRQLNKLLGTTPKTIRELIKQVIESKEFKENDESRGDVSDCWGYDIIQLLDFKSVPDTIDSPDRDKDEYEFQKEPIDFENCDIVSMDEDTITIFAGGDWQDPIVFDCTINKNGELVPVKGSAALSVSEFAPMRREQIKSFVYNTPVTNTEKPSKSTKTKEFRTTSWLWS
jgi:hypothetical protein